MFDHKKYRPFPAINNPNRQWPSKTIKTAPLWCAVDLRDGNQALIEPMSVEQKQTMWQLLVETGFKTIEVGFPSASQTDFDFVRWLIDEQQIPEDVRIQVLVPARDSLIERTFAAVKGAKDVVIHVYNSTSPTQRNKVFNLDKQGITDIAIKGAKKVQSEANKHPNTNWTFQYSPESFSSTEVDFAVDICNAVIEVWQPNPEQKCIINLPATVECATPNVFADQVETFINAIHQRDSIVISIHTHNDRGCAVAAAEMAILAGADRIEGTLMGNGERTGNMDILTMAMNLYSQGINPNLDLSDMGKIERTVAQCTQIPTHARHPWVGDLVYTAFSGSHQDAIKKCLDKQYKNSHWDVAYLPINPSDIGRDYQSIIRINSQSGKGGIAFILESNYGISLPRWMQIEVSQVIQAHCEKMQCEVNASTIHAIFQQHFNPTTRPIMLSGYELIRDKNAKNGQEEYIKAVVLDHGYTINIDGYGDGAISAFCTALSKQYGINMDILQYSQTALEQHTDSKAMACIQMSISTEGITQKYVAVSSDKDTVGASLNAILTCLQQFKTEQKQAA